MRYKLGNKRVVYMFEYSKNEYDINGRLLYNSEKKKKSIYKYIDTKLDKIIHNCNHRRHWNVLYDDNGCIIKLEPSEYSGLIDVWITYYNSLFMYRDGNDKIISINQNTLSIINNVNDTYIIKKDIKVLNYGYVDPVVMFLL